MSEILALSDAVSIQDDARIQFFVEEGAAYPPAADRFIILDGKKAHNIGNACGTCRFLFERMDGANENVSPTQLSEQLRKGIDQIDAGIVDSAMTVLPRGPYKAMLLSCLPTLIIPSKAGDYFFEEQIELWGVDPFWGVPHYAKNEYYRMAPILISEEAELFEFIVPMFPRRYLNSGTIESYEVALRRNSSPTALAVSGMDVRAPATWQGNPNPRVKEHWYLTHYLLDGHHKMYAAAQIGRPITLLSFLAKKISPVTSEIVSEVIKALKRNLGS